MNETKTLTFVLRALPENGLIPGSPPRYAYILDIDSGVP